MLTDCLVMTRVDQSRGVFYLDFVEQCVRDLKLDVIEKHILPYAWRLFSIFFRVFCVDNPRYLEEEEEEEESGLRVSAHSVFFRLCTTPRPDIVPIISQYCHYLVKVRSVLNSVYKNEDVFSIIHNVSRRINSVKCIQLLFLRYFISMMQWLYML